jgi:hypothetical protein
VRHGEDGRRWCECRLNELHAHTEAVIRELSGVDEIELISAQSSGRVIHTSETPTLWSGTFSRFQSGPAHMMAKDRGIHEGAVSEIVVANSEREGAVWNWPANHTCRSERWNKGRAGTSADATQDKAGVETAADGWWNAAPSARGDRIAASRATTVLLRPETILCLDRFGYLLSLPK